MLVSESCGNQFYHYYQLANEVAFPITDNLVEHDFGHGKLVRFTDSVGNVHIAMTIRERSMIIRYLPQTHVLQLLRPTQPNSTFRLFNYNEDGDSYYNGTLLTGEDVACLMEQIVRYI